MDYSLGYATVILGTLVSDAVILLRLRSACRVDRTTGLLRSGIVVGAVVFVAVWLLAYSWPVDLTLVCATSVAILACGLTSFCRSDSAAKRSLRQ